MFTDFTFNAETLPRSTASDAPLSWNGHLPMEDKLKVESHIAHTRAVSLCTPSRPAVAVLSMTGDIVNGGELTAHLLVDYPSPPTISFSGGKGADFEVTILVSGFAQVVPLRRTVLSSPTMRRHVAVVTAILNWPAGPVDPTKLGVQVMVKQTSIDKYLSKYSAIINVHPPGSDLAFLSSQANLPTHHFSLPPLLLPQPSPFPSSSPTDDDRMVIDSDPPPIESKPKKEDKGKANEDVDSRNESGDDSSVDSRGSEGEEDEDTDGPSASTSVVVVQVVIQQPTGRLDKKVYRDAMRVLKALGDKA